MVPARSLPHLVRRNHAAHGATAIRCDDDVVTTPRETTRYMAQEPINQQQQQHDPPKPPPPRETDDHRIQVREPPLQQPTQSQRLQLQLGGEGHHHHHHQQEVAGTSGSSSGGSSSNGGGGNNGGARDWLRLGTGPASPGASGSDHDLFPSDNRATTTTTTAPAPPPPPPLPRHHDVLVLPGMPPGSFLRPGPAMPGIPQASIPTHMPRAGPPWLPPWSPAATPPPPPPLLPFPHHRAFYAAAVPTTPASSGFDAIRVILPPSAVAAAAGVWFVLQAAPHQGREPFLPQIPRSYLRIKDGRVTVRLLTKYLVNKLGLEDESEVEITCRGRQLLPILTLQHVRDSIWCRRDAVSPSAAPDISTADHHHIMVLQYGRRP